jgi:hypothetical protein
MAERDRLLTALVAEVLGPRGGANELLSSDEDPLDEYNGIWPAGRNAESAASENRSLTYSGTIALESAYVFTDRLGPRSQHPSRPAQ